MIKNRTSVKNFQYFFKFPSSISYEHVKEIILSEKMFDQIASLSKKEPYLALFCNISKNYKKSALFN